VLFRRSLRTIGAPSFLHLFLLLVFSNFELSNDKRSVQIDSDWPGTLSVVAVFFLFVGLRVVCRDFDVPNESASWARGTGKYGNLSNGDMADPVSGSICLPERDRIESRCKVFGYGRRKLTPFQGAGGDRRILL
jgi:hypothetical protein